MHKIFGYGNLYCWNCGGRQHRGKRKCPHCGAKYSSYSGPVDKPKKAPTWLSIFHYTVFFYIFKYILFSVIFAFGWCCLMYYVMDVKFEDEQRYVYYILWAFWGIWLLFFAIGKILSVFKTRARNAIPGPNVKCAMCDIEMPRDCNYCPDCGTIIFK
ncbi:MAG: hypothetical protein J6X81_01265 [Muribaculaceae bacterium]|nr:hypothetical protein [Muribaculaceae bacterium]